MLWEHEIPVSICQPGGRPEQADPRGIVAEHLDRVVGGRCWLKAGPTVGAQWTRRRRGLAAQFCFDSLDVFSRLSIDVWPLFLADDPTQSGRRTKRMAQQLPQGWASEWNEQYQRLLFVELATGKTQWEPPNISRDLSLAAPHVPRGAGNRASMPPLASPPAGLAGKSPPAPPAHRSKRQYAANQVAAYDIAPDSVSSGGQFFSPGAPEQQQAQFFPPAGDQGSQPPQYGQPPIGYPGHARGHARTASVGGYGAYGGGQHPGIQGVTQQFGHMGLSQPAHFRLVRVSNDNI
jgi:hypothetical protein